MAVADQQGQAEGASRRPVEPLARDAPDASDVPTPPEAPARRRPLAERPLVRAGVIAWAIAGLVVLGIGVLWVVSRLSIVVVPLVLALFPAAALVPPTSALKRRGWPPALAAGVVLVLGVGLLVAMFGVLVPAVAGELTGLAETVEQGYNEIRQYLAASALHVQTLPLEEIVARLGQQASSQGGELGTRVLEASVRVVEGFAGLAFAVFALFFYLKDGAKIAGWARDLFPARLRGDVQGIGDRVWFTIGAYIRGLLVIGLVDAVLIGTGLWILGIPLALPLSVLVFFGALFPIIGAFLAGTVAVLVALATNGLGAAVAVLVLIVVVQQLEGHILTPVLLGRATELHPLAVIAALTAGAVIAGVVGAFVAVPLAASVGRAVGYVRTRRLQQA